MRIALVGKQRAGKDLVASMLTLLSDGELTKLPLSYMVYEIATQLFGKQEKDRKLLIDIGKSLRSIDEDVFVNFTIDQFRQIDRSTQGPNGFIVPDVRFKNEAEKLKSHGFTLIKVSADDETRISRGADTEYLDDPSESEVDSIECDYAIWNGCTVTKGDLLDQVDDVLKSLKTQEGEC